MYKTATERLLESGAFDLKGCGVDLAADIRAANDDDPQIWSDIKATIRAIQAGTCRRKEAGDIPPDGDWDAPMAKRKNEDIGEIRRAIDSTGRLYRLYVHAPSKPPGTLLLLHLAWKPSNNLGGIGVQDTQIDEAARRLQQWYSQQTT